MKKFKQSLILVHFWNQIVNFEVKLRDELLRKWQLWPKSVIKQVLQSLYNFISTLDLILLKIFHLSKMAIKILLMVILK